jgi:epoxyqueuosine reductase
LNGEALAALLRWSEPDFLAATEGTPIRRIGHLRWLRNVAVAAGNALRAPGLTEADRAALQQALGACADHPSDVVREHVQWALQPAGADAR